MAERFADVGGVELCYETFGAPENPALLLVMGLGMQMIAWPEEFCEELAERGHYVVRFDNRDCGRSTRFDDHPAPSLWQLVRRDRAAAAYTLADMARDAVGLLDELGIDRAHVIGASMGGMIAQLLAAEYPDRVSSLASVMSNTGHRRDGRPAPRAYRLFLRRRPRDRAAAVSSSIAAFRILSSPAFPFDAEAVRALAERSYDRGYHPEGTARQLHAILAAGDRTGALRRVASPTVVVHGTHDVLLRPSGGRATAAAIRGARLLEIDGMGHDLPRGVWDRITDAVIANMQRASRYHPAR